MGDANCPECGEENREKMALWIAFTVNEFSAKEINTLCKTLTSKTNEIKSILKESNDG
jgi:hypothetical protein